MTVYYYPGCSLHSTAAEYDRSVRLVAAALDSPLVELPDWTCCGASSGHSLDEWLALALAARNLVRAMDSSTDDGQTTVMAPCAACYNRLARAAHALQDEAVRTDIETTLSVRTTGTVAVIDAVSFIQQLIAHRRPSRPLDGLRVACYYGCLLVRPPEITGHRYHEQPRSLDQLCEWAGAQPVRWPGRTDCCGASLGLVDSSAVSRLVNGIVTAARDAGAQALVTACPLCQSNLEMRASPDNRLPSFYFTELLAVSMGLDVRSCWTKHLVDPVPVLSRLNLE